MPGVQDVLEEFAKRNEVPANLLHDVQLAVEEHLTNVISYGYIDGREHEIQLGLHLDAHALHVEIVDDAQPFDPLVHPPPDLSIPIDERPIGGLGIHMMRKVLDDMSYRWEHGRNILRMTKNLSTA